MGPFLVGLFVFLLLNLHSYWCILDNSSLLDIFCKYFFFVCGLFSLSLGTVLLEQFLILMKSSLSIISFMDHAFGDVSKESSPNRRSSRFSPRLSIFYEFYGFVLYIQVHDPFWVNFCSGLVSVCRVIVSACGSLSLYLSLAYIWFQISSGTPYF